MGNKLDEIRLVGGEGLIGRGDDFKVGSEGIFGSEGVNFLSRSLIDIDFGFIDIR